jgi:hypothetical protein
LQQQRRYNGEQSEAAYMDSTKARTIEISDGEWDEKRVDTENTAPSATLLARGI